MKIYNYDRDTGEYTCESLAEKNQVGAGYLIPAFASEIAPPDFGENEKPFFENNQWIIKPYFKGKKQVDLSNKIVSTVDYYGEIKDGFQFITEKTAEELNATPDKFKVVNGKLKKLTNAEYSELLRQKEIEQKKLDIEYQLKQLDEKRVRAICEPEIKDEITGETWLDYYNQQITELRAEYNNLQNEG